MNKKEFLSSIEARIINLPQNDRMKSLEYYGEMIDDRIEEGMSEETAVEAMGSIDDIVSQILLDASLPALVKFKVRPSRTLRVWEILLIILGSPIWLPLLLSFAIIILSVYIVIWSIVISLYAVDLSIAVGFLAGIFMGIIFAVTGFGIQAAWLIGSGFICGGVFRFYY